MVRSSNVKKTVAVVIVGIKAPTIAKGSGDFLKDNYTMNKTVAQKVS